MAALRPLIAGNWKMHGRRDSACALATDLARRARRAAAGAGALPWDLLVCPPAPLLAEVRAALTDAPVALGGQDCHHAADGPHTGDVSAAMLADAGCRFVIVGHSERRADHAETDALVRAKAEAAHAAGLVAVVCVGESEAERSRGETLAVVGRQLAGSLPAAASAENCVVAYEPVWAIGTGRTPTAEEVAEVHRHLRDLLRRGRRGGEAVRLLYGGSVKPANARAFLQIPEVDGALVGGASLVAADFWAIAEASV